MVFKPGDKRYEGAGRKKGVANLLTEKHKELIAKSDPISFLINAFTKGYIEDAVNPAVENYEKYVTLTYKDRCEIARDLAKKIVPDLKSVDHGDVGGLITFIMNSSINHAPNEMLKVDERGK